MHIRMWACRYAASCLWGGLELLHFAVYTLKAAAALACAFLAAKIHIEAEAGVNMV